jgi:CDP-diacylglycerol---glycerol-3-phosphate 3-phosphatidyltransferase
MFARRITRCPAIRSSVKSAKPTYRLNCRRMSTSTAPTVPSTPVPSMLWSLTDELDKLAPRFEMNAAQIHILRSPSEFYETLKVVNIFDWVGLG